MYIIFINNTGFYDGIVYVKNNYIKKFIFFNNSNNDNTFETDHLKFIKKAAPYNIPNGTSITAKIPLKYGYCDNNKNGVENLSILNQGNTIQIYEKEIYRSYIFIPK